MNEAISHSSRPTVIFAGSFVQYSALVLEKLLASPLVHVIGVLTTPPHATGRSKIPVANPVHQLAEANNVPLMTPTELNDAILSELTENLGRPQLLVTAGYGKLVPPSWLAFPELAALNLHFSLLPAYRGANPAEWALLRGEKRSGVTLIEMSPAFDTGTMVAQAETSLTETDTRETVYDKLYSLGGDVLPEMITAYTQFKHGRIGAPASDAITYFLPPINQPDSPTPYAKRLGREDGYIGWVAIKDAMAGQHSDPTELSPQLQNIFEGSQLTHLDAIFIERAIRALAGFPGVWSMVETTKGLRRLKLLTAHLEHNALVLDSVQLEGETATTWEQLKTTSAIV